MARADIKPAGTLTEMVSGRIREQIGRGDLKPGDCVPSERELSRVLSVSRVTARNGLNQLVNAGLLRREPGRGYFVRSRGGAAANQAAGTALVFVHAKASQEMSAGSEHARMWEGAREEAAKAGMMVLVSPLEEGVITPEKASEFSKVAAGVICDHTDYVSLKALLDAGLPTVQIHYYREDLPIDAVVQDDVGGIRMAMAHLAERGHRRIGYLDTSAWLRREDRGRNAEMRLGGYLIARASLGLEEDPRLVVAVDDERRGALEVLIAAGASAVVSPHVATWDRARDGVELPSDFGVVVWMGQPVTPRQGNVPTHVIWSREEMGRVATRMLLSRIEDPERAATTTLIRTELVDCDTGGRDEG
jgi:DNA-binding LacI/PurR family transcriptional regulator